ncbi:casein kinase II subunit beta-2-like isoform X1 [Silene latifolia]|uniref:casein kinase II subunit beta-2-like isoform X1 n=1 Tax=Silene latifolia TaxID=37657 RepID=UPI003D785E1B
MYKERVVLKVSDMVDDPKPITQTIEILPDELLSLVSTTSGSGSGSGGEKPHSNHRSLPPSNIHRAAGIIKGKIYKENVSDTVDDPKPINQTLEILPDEPLSLVSTTSGSDSGDGKPHSNQRSLPRSNIRRAGEESETDSEESDVGSKDEDTSWISWFCNLRGNEFFCEVDEDYIVDDFNLYGLNRHFPFYDNAMELILDVKFSQGDVYTEEQNELVKSTAVMLYGLIHARYILTSRGMAAMLEKYENVEFGRCPRSYCSVQPCLPVGQSDLPRSRTVKIYCPKCEDIYFPRSKYQGNVDGAYFGTAFPHLFLMTYPLLKPQKPSQSYTPRVFGFKLHNP